MGLQLELAALSQSKQSRNWLKPLLLCSLALLSALLSRIAYTPAPPTNAREILSRCAQLHARPGVPVGFHERTVSDRYDEGTPATLIRNATIWTGGRDGTEVVYGDIFLHKGIIKAIGLISKRFLQDATTGSISVIDANGAWITPGIFDLHSHVGLLSSPSLNGAIDANSPNGPVIPWLRSLDALNTRDESYRLAIAGGTIGGLILPGSGNIIGGQAFPIKYRKTRERTPSSMLIEPPYNLNNTTWDGSEPLRWRHMKHATGENQNSHGTRMDATWNFREAYDEARKVKEAQDSYCRKAERGLWGDADIKDKDFPYSLKWEALVDVLRGRVKVNCHTYEAVDIDFLSRLTNEFKFSIAAIHHAHEAYLVPETLKRFWGNTPTVAIFATNARYKRESYRGSEFAGRILADNGIKVVYKSDHPVINSRYLAFEAQQGHYYSLPTNLALRSLTTEPAIAAGLDHRIGLISKGYDADIVIWDSHPLALGATPQQVFIDGIAQIEDPHVLARKGEEFQKPPRTPSWDDEINKTLKWDGLPPLQSSKKLQNVEFVNVRSFWQRSGSSVLDAFGAHANAYESQNHNHTVIVTQGKVTCFGPSTACVAARSSKHETVDLMGGSLSLGLTTYGSPLGLSEISSEEATGDDGRYQPLSENPPAILHDQAGAIAGVDALQFEGRDTLLAYRSGVTSAIGSWSWYDILGPNPGTFAGLSVAFRTGASHGLEKGAVVKPHAALQVIIGHNHGASVSTQVAAIRNGLLGNGSSQTQEAFNQAAKGELPFIVDVESADIMVNLIKLKYQIEEKYQSKMRMAFSGAGEAHLIADEIATAGIGVILKPLHAHPTTWDGRRIIPGPPLTKTTSVTLLSRKGINVAIGVRENWQARNTLFEAAWASMDSDGQLDKGEALALVSTNLNSMFGLHDDEDADLVVFEGGDIFSMESKVIGIVSPRDGHVEMF